MSRREIQKRRLRKIIREACMEESHGEMPCPIETGNLLKSSGAHPDEVLAWVSEMMDVYRGAPQKTIVTPTHDPLSIVAVERYRRQGSHLNRQNGRNSLSLGSTILGIGFEK